LKRPELSSAQQLSQQQVQLEYSPFSYTFNKTAGWLPGELAPNNPSTTCTATSHAVGGPINLVNNSGGSPSSARAMNFASAAATGITSTTMSSTGGHMSQIPGAGIMNGPNHVIAPVDMKDQPGPMHENVGDAPKADASKAPGYRGNSSGSPILRMTQQPPNMSNPPFNMEGPLSSQFALSAGLMNPSSNILGYNSSGRPTQPQQQQPGGFGQFSMGPPGQFGGPHGQDNMMSSQPSAGPPNPMMYGQNRYCKKEKKTLVQIILSSEKFSRLHDIFAADVNRKITSTLVTLV